MTDPTMNAGDRPEHDSKSDTYRTTYSLENVAPSTVVIEAVATVAECDLTELEPLYSVIDPEALDALFRPTVNGRRQGDAEVSFAYHEHDITVRSYGIIEIEPAG